MFFYLKTSFSPKYLEVSNNLPIFAASECRQRARNPCFRSIFSSWTVLTVILGHSLARVMSLAFWILMYLPGTCPLAACPLAACPLAALMLHINIIYGFNYPNAKGCDTSKRRPRALRILRNIPAPGSTLPFSMREIYDLLVPTR